MLGQSAHIGQLTWLERSARIGQLASGCSCLQRICWPLKYFLSIKDTLETLDALVQDALCVKDAFVGEGRINCLDALDCGGYVEMLLTVVDTTNVLIREGHIAR